MKKVFDQTVRDLKRGVNKKVLKVPGIEQKVLDATSNEPWGPHGSLLADIAHASKNYHEYQMIMIVIWKRINDTGKNWRHVYKGLTVLEYLVAHGSERVIEEIKEHAYQISTLSDFQYIDSGGRDQGSNVRKKSQSLVLLVNDKERILEVRQKAAANRDKFRNTSSTGGMYRPGSYSSSGGYGDRYDDDRYEGRYGSRDDDRNSYGREREGGYKDDDRYGRYGDNSSRDGERNGRDSEDHYGRDSYRDDNYRGRSRSVDDYNNNSRSRSSDRDQDRAFDDDGNSSSRGSGARADEHSQEGRRLDRKFSEQNLGDPPSYEDVVSNRSPVHNERVGETSAASAPKTSSPPACTSPSRATTGHVTLASPANQGVDTFDEFDPRGAVSAPPTTSNSAEVDFLGSLSESYSSNALAIMPAIPATAIPEADAHGSSGFAVNQACEDPFGDTPFKATPSAGDISGQPPSFASTTSFHPSMNQSSAQPQPFSSKVDGVSNFDFGDTFPGISYTSSSASSGPPPSTNPQFMSQELSIPNHDIDILADILPPSGPLPPTASQDFPASVVQPTQPSTNAHDTFLPQSGATAQTPSGPAAQYNSGFFPQSGFTGPVGSNMPPPSPSESIAQHNGASFLQQSGSFAPVVPQAVGPSGPNNAGNFHSHHGAFQSPTGPAVSHHGAFQSPTGPAAHHGAFQSPTGPAASYHGAFQSPTGPAVTQNNDVLGNFLPQVQPTNSMSSQSSSPASMGQLAIVPQPSKEKFEPKSTVWADTLSRGLVNFNISGSKTNPLADIGIDFEAINRKEKRMEKPTAAPVASNITMGKAMGSGSGIGRAGAGAIRPPTTPMIGSGMGMGMGMGGAPRPGMGMGMGGAPSSGMGMGMGMGGGAPGAGMGMGGYGGMNQPMGMGMGMNMSMGMGQGAQMQQQPGLPPGSTMSGGYNPMMGAGGYAPQPYGGGYR